MSKEPYRRGAVPVWFTILLIILVIPGFLVGFILPRLNSSGDELRTIMRLYPYYIAAAALFAWICYPERRLMAWILVGLVVLSHVMVAALASMPEI